MELSNKELQTMLEVLTYLNEVSELSHNEELLLEKLQNQLGETL